MKKQLYVSKYNASGNDFVIFTAFIEKDYSQLAIKLCDRISGIGADGLVVVLPSEDKSIDFKWDFYNNDGSKASMCGNASRAVSHYAFCNNLVSNSNMSFLSDAGIINTSVKGNIVESMMVLHKEQKDPFEQDGFLWYFVDTGVPHLVTICEDLNDFSIEIARKLRHKYNANVNFIVFKNQDMNIRTYERGVENETLACGTGMCAGFLWARKNNLAQESINVYPKSQEIVSLRYENERIYMKGAVDFIFSSVISVGML